MKILVTGSAGFIGFHLSKLLASNGHEVVGLDSINNYYDTNLKYGRLSELGILREEAAEFNNLVQSKSLESFRFVRIRLHDASALNKLLENESFEVICHMAAQAGVRYSITHPHKYVESNLVGFANLIEASKRNGIRHFIYASSSSVYGKNPDTPFTVDQRVDRPISHYAATKRSNELMAYTYSHLFGMRTTGLRFFTVYGPWGRPDMALFLFTKAILKGEAINVFNNGDLARDFTYVDDIVQGIQRIVNDEYTADFDLSTAYHLYNIGRNQPIKLMDFISEIENQLQTKAKLNMQPMQPGDVPITWADTSKLKLDYGYQTLTPLKKGIAEFVSWYREFYKV